MKSSLTTRYFAILIASVFPNLLNAEPLFNPLISDKQIGGVGYFFSNTLDVPYKGIALQNYTVSRAQSGLVLTFGSKKLSNRITEIQADEQESTKPDETTTKVDEENLQNNKKSKSSPSRIIYLQGGIGDSAELQGTGNLNGNELTGQNFTFGVTYGSSYSGSGLFVFYEFDLIDESVSYIANGITTAGSFEGADFTIGFGIGLSAGRRIAFNGTIAYTYSSLEFTRSQDMSFGNTEFPINEVQVDKVSRTKRVNFGIMATINVLPSLHLSLHALTGSEESATAMLRYSFL